MILEPKVIQVRVQFNSAYYLQSMSSIELPQDCYLLGIIRENSFIEVSKNPTMIEQDIIVAVTTHPGFGPLLKHQLKKTQSEVWRFHNGHLNYCPA
ncbi:hypothetical protein [Gloeocapsa sp. PCC 73106]|uniref:hypothetical protein n=1 Tax=Gloeocapsa sp. PCC 73106 TaxID=102232 RepID=UPI0002AB9D85|nr:hypothetical protein [Gloeocapsa sp. PCC 73106]ELR99885.1 hypothetical protein GLO73106DRAFT_00037380 [Gloeocapsa sp. PCC 73106]